MALTSDHIRDKLITELAAEYVVGVLRSFTLEHLQYISMLRHLCCVGRGGYVRQQMCNQLQSACGLFPV